MERDDLQQRLEETRRQIESMRDRAKARVEKIREARGLSPLQQISTVPKNPPPSSIPRR